MLASYVASYIYVPHYCLVLTYRIFMAVVL